MPPASLLDSAQRLAASPSSPPAQPHPSDKMVRSFFAAAALTGALYTAPATAQKADWTVTEFYQLSAMLTTFSGRTTPYTSSVIRTVSPGITPTASPSTTRSYLSTNMDIGTVLYISATMFPNAVAETDLVPDRRMSSTLSTSSSEATRTYTSYVSPIVYTAPASCPTVFTYSTSTSLSIPTDIRPLITPTSTSTRTYSGYSGTTYTKYLFLSASALPAASTTRYDPTYTRYIAYCTNPATLLRSGGSGSSSSGSGSSSSDSYYCWGYLCNTNSLQIYIIILAAVLPTLFVLGFLEAFFWFRRLMTGRSALRFGTVCWVCISLWVLCFTRKAQARSKEDQVVLRKRWNDIKFGRKVGLFWKWQFRHRYPAELLATGAAPIQDGNGGAPPAYVPGKEQNGQNGQSGGFYGPPGGGPLPAHLQHAYPQPASAAATGNMQTYGQEMHPDPQQHQQQHQHQQYYQPPPVPQGQGQQPYYPPPQQQHPQEQHQQYGNVGVPAPYYPPPSSIPPHEMPSPPLSSVSPPPVFEAPSPPLPLPPQVAGSGQAHGVQPTPPQGPAQLHGYFNADTRR